MPVFENDARRVFRAGDLVIIRRPRAKWSVAASPNVCLDDIVDDIHLVLFAYETDQSNLNPSVLCFNFRLLRSAWLYSSDLMSIM